MHLEEFSVGASIIHRLDPRAKILAAFFFSILTAAADKPPVLTAALAAGMLLVITARLPRRLLLKRIILVNTFILFLWLFLPFSHPGHEIFRIGPFVATREGLVFALIVTMKSNAIVLAGIALLSTSTLNSLIHALSHLKVPDKLVHLFFFTFRYFQVIHLEYLRLRAAMRIRCFTPKTNMHTYRSLAYLVGMILVRSYERSERVHQAMICRGYQGRFWLLDHFSFQGRDTLFLILMTTLIMLLAWAQWASPIS